MNELKTTPEDNWLTAWRRRARIVSARIVIGPWDFLLKQWMELTSGERVLLMVIAIMIIGFAWGDYACS